MVRKIKGKQWYKILAPKFFDNKELGKTPVGDPETLEGRIITSSLVNLMNDPSKYYLKFSFKITEFKDKTALTEFWRFECLRDYISKMIRHGILRIDNVVDVKTKDGVRLRVKTIALTNRKATKQIELALRKYIQEKIEEELNDLTLNEFLNKFLNQVIKRKILDEGSKIYPIYKFEMRKVERLTESE